MKYGKDRGRGTMHRAQGKQKTIKQEGHNSLCPYNTNKDKGRIAIRPKKIINKRFQRYRKKNKYYE
ncbi:MAG: hypothetical protein WBF68_05490 [Atribacterota bacterium]